MPKLVETFSKTGIPLHLSRLTHCLAPCRPAQPASLPSQPSQTWANLYLPLPALPPPRGKRKSSSPRPQSEECLEDLPVQSPFAFLWLQRVEFPPHPGSKERTVWRIRHCSPPSHSARGSGVIIIIQTSATLRHRRFSTKEVPIHRLASGI